MRSADYLGSDPFWDLLVRPKLHCVAGPPLGNRTQGGRVSKGLCQWHESFEDLDTFMSLDALDLGSPRTEVSQNISEELPGVTTSMSIMGSRRMGFPFLVPSLTAIEVALLKAISEESTV